MPTITPVDPAHATGKAKQLLDAVQAKLGITPNLMKTLATSPAALEAYLNFSGALGGGLLEAQFREQIALAVGQANSCQYCLSAHTVIGGMVGLKPEEIKSSRESHSTEARKNAGLQFAQSIVVHRGEVAPNAVENVRKAGFSDGEIIEIVLHVALNILTNYVNHVAQTEIDFPRVEVAIRTAA
jgi:uncharacterized peroxidase-related enzyme